VNKKSNHISNLTHKVVLMVIALIISTQYSNAQFKSKKKKREAIVELNALAESNDFNIYEFKNINRIREYFNKSKLQHIVNLEKEKNWPKLYYALKDYIKNFAIRNFYVDTYWIWRLAKLTELYGTEEEARSLYKLVLRHHHDGIDIQEIEIYYDSLNTQMTDQYVPLDYYYKLVEHRKSIDTLRPPPGILLNMGRRINSRKADYGPTLALNDDVLIYTSQRNESSRGLDYYENEDLFFSRRNNGFWEESQEVKNINSQYNEGSACLSRDKKTLYFSRCESPQSIGNCDIFMAKMLEDSTWGDIQNLGFNVNSISWDSHPSLSHTEDTLYFASDRIGGFGLSDIYFTYKEKDGWSHAQNLGPVINTRKNDVSPFFHPKEEVLYFSSNGQLYSFGEFDIYKAYYNEEKWSEPVNIGPLVNGAGNEFYFTIDSESRDLYYSRSANRDMEKQDIYSFPLPMGANPYATTKVTGSLMDSLTGKPFTGIVSIIDIEDHVEVAPKYLRSDGSFEFDLVNKRNYLLVIQGDEFFRVEEMFYLDGPMDFRKITEPIASRMKFESIEFDVGQAHLKSEMYGDLNKIVNFMYDNLDFYLKISGHTDSFGAAATNLKLSKERAQTIRDYIVIFGGLEEERVSSEGYGSTRPLVNEVTEEDKTLNRRVEFEIFRPAVGIDQGTK
jgi:outer membrane protein OmpA-like peptidoglycan-associated protein